jgi:hypothetical protein
MGLIRKAASVSTFGLIDFRSDKERQARYAKQTREAQREQLKIEKDRAKHPQPPAPQVLPAGWYPDTQNASLVRWWDGAAWTDKTQARR